MHVSQADIFRRQFGLLPFSGQPGLSSHSPPTTKDPLAVPRGPTCGGGGGIPIQTSWDPKVFQPDGGSTKAVSRYCGLQFSDEDLPPVSQKPGTGFSKEGCGKWVRTLKSGGYTKKIVHNCDVLSCPVCMPGAITQKASDIEKRFELYELAKISENAVLIPGEVRDVTPRHFVFTISPIHTAKIIHKMMRKPGIFDNEKDLDLLDPENFLDLVREEFKIALRKSGLIGGLYIYHDARVRHPDTGVTGSRAKHLIRREAMLCGTLKDEDPDWKIYDHIRKQKNSDRYYYFSPHFHVVAYGKIIDIKSFEAQMPGWKYHNKNSVKTPGGLARYLISHMAMLPNRHSCAWFGRLSSAVLGKTELKTVEKPVICESTGKAWIIVSSTITSEIGREYTEKVTIYQGFFRKKKRKYQKDGLLPYSLDLLKRLKAELTEEEYLSFKMEEPPKALQLPGTKRPICPPHVKEKGIKVLGQYCDEWGKL